MAKALPRGFFNRPVLKVARDLIGCSLVRRMPDGKIARSMITETEAYDGERDKACHAARGRTARNGIMYGEAGHWYAYFTYGMHWMLNAVTGPKGYPAAVLIRGLEDVTGPGRLTKALKIGKELNGKSATRRSGLWIEARPEGWRGKISRSKRIGIDYAGPIWTEKEWRFTLEKAMVKEKPELLR